MRVPDISRILMPREFHPHLGHLHDELLDKKRRLRPNG